MRKTWTLLLILILMWGCSTFNRSYKLGTDAAMNKDWDEAVRFYEKAVLQDPDNSVYRLALFRAAMAARNQHLSRARRLAAQDRTDEAMQAYQKALAYDPENPLLQKEIKELQQKPEEAPEAKKDMYEPPLQLQVGREDIVLKFTRDASLRSIFLALGKYAGINVIFDAQFRDQPFSVDFSGMSFLRALETLCVATQNFHRVLDEKTILIVPDSPQNRSRHEITAMKTYYLSYIDAQELQARLNAMLRTPSAMPQLTVDKVLNSVTVKSTPEVLKQADGLIRSWDKPRGEILLDLEIMEVSRRKMKQLGLDLDSHVLGFQYGGEGTTGGSDSDKGWIDFDQIDLSKTGNYQLSLPVGLLRFLETDADTKIIAQPRLRGIEGEKMEYLVGDEVPIPQTTFSPMAAGGVSTQPITSFQYKPVGIEMYITPRIHFDGEVTLEMELKIKALGGSGYGDLPIITTREVKNIMRLKEGETNLLAGLLKDEERKTLKGIAGIKHIPLLGRLFSNTDSEVLQTDVVMTITPFILQDKSLREADLRPIWMGMESVSAGTGASGRDPDSPEMIYPGSEMERLPRRLPDQAMEREEETAEGANELILSPPSYQGPENRNLRMTVNLQTAEDIQNFSMTVSFDPQILELQSVKQGNIIQQLGESPSVLENIDNTAGVFNFGFSSSQVDSGVKGSGLLVTFIFKPLQGGETTVSIVNSNASSDTGTPVSFSANDSRIIIRE
ncbi:MAG: cohesin domain-containing protein [Candidatus Aminicenantes bacterium]